MKRDIDDLFENLSAEEIAEENKEDLERANKQYSEFIEYYKKGMCYICKKSFETLSSKNPCIHSLLRQNKFKNKSFPEIYNKRGYHNIATYLRRVANQDTLAKNINNLESEKGKNKFFEYTIKWRQISRSFCCSYGDLVGHTGHNSSFPHYHFDMRIDGRPFIKYSDFHLPFNEQDLFFFEIETSKKATFQRGGIGHGIQEELEYLDSQGDNGLNQLQVTQDENEAVYTINTMITGSITDKEIKEIAEESKRSGKPMGVVARNTLGKKKVQVIIKPMDNIPDIVNRSNPRN